jgi:hypothetical protein
MQLRRVRCRLTGQLAYVLPCGPRIERSRAVSIPLGDAEVHDLQHAAFRQEEILGLDVPVDDSGTAVPIDARPTAPRVIPAMRSPLPFVVSEACCPVETIDSCAVGGNGWTCGGTGLASSCGRGPSTVGGPRPHLRRVPPGFDQSHLLRCERSIDWTGRTWNTCSRRDQAKPDA